MCTSRRLVTLGSNVVCVGYCSCISLFGCEAILSRPHLTWWSSTPSLHQDEVPFWYWAHQLSRLRTWKVLEIVEAFSSWTQGIAKPTFLHCILEGFSKLNWLGSYLFGGTLGKAFAWSGSFKQLHQILSIFRTRVHEQCQSPTASTTLTTEPPSLRLLLVPAFQVYF